MQGYFGGWIDLYFQRFIEIWSGIPVLYLLIILASFVEPNFWWLLGLMLLFSWMGLVGVVRAEFLRARNFDYVRAARALGVGDGAIMFRHILPNAMVATLTFLPFILSGSIVTLTSLDFLGFGLPPGSPSLGELLNQGKNNLQAPWLGITGFWSLASCCRCWSSSARPSATRSTRARRSAEMALLEVQDLSVTFGRGAPAVKGASFALDRGQTMAIVGESGSGKLRCLVGPLGSRRLARDYERLSETLAGLHYVAFSLLMLHKAAPLFAGRFITRSKLGVDTLEEDADIANPSLAGQRYVPEHIKKLFESSGLRGIAFRPTVPRRDGGFGGPTTWKRAGGPSGGN